MIPLTLLPGRTDTTRIGRDRLELLTALIEAPSFDPLYRDTLIFIPPQHPVLAWQCGVDGCERGFDHFLRQRLLTGFDVSVRPRTSRIVTSFEGTC